MLRLYSYLHTARAHFFLLSLVFGLSFVCGGESNVKCLTSHSVQVGTQMTQVNMHCLTHPVLSSLGRIYTLLIVRLNDGQDMDNSNDLFFCKSKSLGTMSWCVVSVCERHVYLCPSRGIIQFQSHSVHEHFYEFSIGLIGIQSLRIIILKYVAISAFTIVHRCILNVSVGSSCQLLHNTYKLK